MKQSDYLKVSVRSGSADGSLIYCLYANICDEKAGELMLDEGRLSDHFGSVAYQIDTSNKINGKVERYRSELARFLNAQNKQNYSVAGWGKIVDSWLCHFVSVVYDRLNHLDVALGINPNLSIPKVSDHPLPPITAKHFRSEAAGDRFNQYIYEVVFDVRADVSPAASESLVVNTYPPVAYGGRSAVRRMLRRILRAFLGRLADMSRSVMVLDGYFDLRDVWQMLIRSKGRIIALPSRLLFDGTNEVAPWERCKIDWNARSKFRFSEHDIYDKVANRIFNVSFPLTFLEGFACLKSQVAGFMSLPAIGSATGFHSSDAYKILSAEIAERDGKIFCIQHGGDYNFQKYNMAEYYEKRNSDYWYAWGSAGVNPMPSTKARKLKQYNKKQDNGKVLFVSTAKKRYQIRQEVELPAEDYPSMVREQFRFYRLLDVPATNHFVLRPYPIDLGWGYNRMWDEEFSGRVMLDKEGNYFKSLESARVVVTDHFSTTWLEAIFFDVPLIVYCDLERLVFDEGSKDYFEQMQSASILHKNAESAADFLNRIYSDVDAWWMSEHTRTVVAGLKDAFVSESDDFLPVWIDELMRLRDGQ